MIHFGLTSKLNLELINLVKKRVIRFLFIFVDVAKII